MSFKSFLFWSSILTLPLPFLFKKKQPETVLDDEPIVEEPDAPPEPAPPGDTVPAEFRDFKPPSLPGYVRMKSSEVPASIRPRLPPLLAGTLGTVTKLPTEGRDIAAIIEPHFHEPGGPVKPWGWHKGVSLYERKGQLA